MVPVEYGFKKVLTILVTTIIGALTIIVIVQGQSCSRRYLVMLKALDDHHSQQSWLLRRPSVALIYSRCELSTAASS